MATPTLSQPEYPDNGLPQGIFDGLQSALTGRFTRTPTFAEPLTYEFTDDKALLHQYYILRERMLGTDKFMPKNALPQDMHDKISHTLIARRGRLCVGGARLTIREGDEAFSLPMETDEFKLRELFPHLPLGKRKHAVGSKFAILDYEKNHDILYTLCKIMYEKVVGAGVHYYFVRATNITLARNWRLIFNSMRPNSTRICTEIDVPESPMYPGEHQYLVFSDLSDSTSYAPKPQRHLLQKEAEINLSLVD